MRSLPDWFLNQPPKPSYSPRVSAGSTLYSPAIDQAPPLSLVASPTAPARKRPRHNNFQRVHSRSNGRTWLMLLQRLGLTAIGHSTVPPIVKFENGSDCWWYTWDPDTNQYLYADSEAELRLWIQRH